MPKGWGSLSDRKPAIPTFYIENRQVIGETMTDQFILTGPLYQLSEDLPTFFLKISQSEIINTKEIDHLHFTSGGSVQIHLKTGV